MTRLKLTVDSSLYVDNKIIVKGDVFEVPDKRAKELLDLKHAVVYVEPKPEPKPEVKKADEKAK